MTTMFNPDTLPLSEPALELHSKAASSGPYTDSTSGGGQIIKKIIKIPYFSLFSDSNSFIRGKSIFSKFIEQPLRAKKI